MRLSFLRTGTEWRDHSKSYILLPKIATEDKLIDYRRKRVRLQFVRRVSARCFVNVLGNEFSSKSHRQVGAKLDDKGHFERPFNRRYISAAGQSGTRFFTRPPVIFRSIGVSENFWKEMSPSPKRSSVSGLWPGYVRGLLLILLAERC